MREMNHITGKWEYMLGYEYMYTDAELLKQKKIFTTNDTSARAMMLNKKDVYHAIEFKLNLGVTN